ncbi:MAG TPA: TAT-variant-translocated molybdopterin oxidoreductase [Arenibaculum sp.]|nr:TAT-variant-translocated molybdopterin oxidoreductase [Arenibaculum sp.]
MTDERDDEKMQAPPVPEDRRHWRSLGARADAPEYRRWLESEFPHLGDGVRTDRRSILKLMGASAGLAGLAACGEAPSDPIVSRARETPGHTVGEPLYFATSLPLDGYGRGVLVESHEGRPTKIEGNPLHPASRGATDAFAQAAVVSLYDPDRSRTVRRQGRPSREPPGPTLPVLADDLAGRRGAGLRLVTGPVSSPSLTGAIGALLDRLPEAAWIQWSPVGDENRRDGAALAFGRPLETRLDLERADVIVTLDADPLGPGPDQVANAAGFIAGRRDPGRFSRLWAFEPGPTLTGARADHRTPLPPHAVAALARSLAAAFGLLPDGTGNAPLPPGLVEELRRAGANAVVTAGRRQPPEVHALTHAINAALGAVGTTVHYTEPVLAEGPHGIQALVDLAGEIAAGEVSHLVLLDCNPAYDAPADLGMAGLIRRVPFSLHLGLHADETAMACSLHVPMAHTIESWGDLRGPDGTVGLVQPAVAPLAGGLTPHEVVARLAGSDEPAYRLVRAYWETAYSGPDFEAFWRQALHDGIVPGTARDDVTVQLVADWQARLPAAPPPPAGVSAIFEPDPCVWDGCFANNAWLQELPKPLTKLVWDNAILLGPETAIEHGLDTGDGAVVGIRGRAVEGPVLVVPGHAPGCVTLPLGYGRRRAGSVGDRIGFDAYAVRSSQAPWIDDTAAIRPSGRTHRLVTTQDHGTMAGRDIVRSVALGDLPATVPEDEGISKDADAPRPSIYPEYRYDGPAWGMAVDLNACIGCNACVVACQAENNVPVVGKEEVARGREMHWLRIDRYWEGPPEDPRVHWQPVLCMHCEKAPCEVVCPVNATVHDSEGLNVMVYNRCVGTRYCSNNCPYKVRRFNWFDYADEGRPDGTINPEVTVRARGVMEKCTYCMHRIAEARIRAKVEDRPIADGEVRTACQQACPTRTFTFGDLNDPGSAVNRARRSPLEYALLGELNTQPRTTYLARIDNPPQNEGPPDNEEPS